jgi:hypothetical protein
MFWLRPKRTSAQRLPHKSLPKTSINGTNQLEWESTRRPKQESICCLSNQHCDPTKTTKNTGSVTLRIGKRLVLRSSRSLGPKEGEPMRLCSLSADNDYRNHTSLDLTGEIRSRGKWTKTRAMVDSGCTPLGMIDTEYAKTQKLNI